MSIKKQALPIVIVLVAIGTVASMAAIQTSGSDTSLARKFVIVGHPGTSDRVSEDVRFESFGQTDFVVVPVPQPDKSSTYDYWIPLDEVSSMRVFDSKKDAKSYLDSSVRQIDLPSNR